MTLPLKIPGPYRGSCGWPFQRSKLNFAFFTILISSNSKKGLFYCTQKKDSLRNLQILLRTFYPDFLTIKNTKQTIKFNYISDIYRCSYFPAAHYWLISFCVSSKFLVFMTFKFFRVTVKNLLWRKYIFFTNSEELNYLNAKLWAYKTLSISYRNNKFSVPIAKKLPYSRKCTH